MIIIADFISETMQVRRPWRGIFKVLKKKKKKKNCQPRIFTQKNITFINKNKIKFFFIKMKAE